MKTSFNSKQEAENFLNSIAFLENNKGNYSPAGTYYLANNEYARKYYTVRKYKDGYGIHCVHSYYPGTYNAAKSGRIREEEIENLRRFSCVQN